MALEKPQTYAKSASRLELRVLESLTGYYRGEYSLGYAAETVEMPLRAIVEFMQNHQLPFYSDSADAEEGLRRVSKIRSTL